MGQHFRSDERFVPVPLSLIQDPDLNAYHFATYIAIRERADFGKETGSFVSDRAGALRAGISERKFRECRTALRAKGWLEWSGREGHKNHYIVRSKVTPAPQTGVLAPPPAHDADPPAPHAGDTPAPHADYLEPVLPKALPENSGSSDELPARIYDPDCMACSGTGIVFQNGEKGKCGICPFQPNDLVKLVTELGLNGQRPPQWGKQAKAAKRLIDAGLNNGALVREACRGMRMLFPFAPPPAGKRQPFDVFTLERKLPEALAEAVNDKPPSDVVEHQAHGEHGPRGGHPTPLGNLLEGVLERARARAS